MLGGGDVGLARVVVLGRLSFEAAVALVGAGSGDCDGGGEGFVATDDVAVVEVGFVNAVVVVEGGGVGIAFVCFLAVGDNNGFDTDEGCCGGGGDTDLVPFFGDGAAAVVLLATIALGAAVAAALGDEAAAAAGVGLVFAREDATDVVVLGTCCCCTVAVVVEVTPPLPLVVWDAPPVAATAGTAEGVAVAAAVVVVPFTIVFATIGFAEEMPFTDSGDEMVKSLCGFATDEVPIGFPSPNPSSRSSSSSSKSKESTSSKVVSSFCVTATLLLLPPLFLAGGASALNGCWLL